MNIQSNLLDYILQHSPIGVTIADAQVPDTPLIFANAGFMNITGYSLSEVIGKNCRFLQAHDTKQAAARLMNDAIGNGEGCRTILRNYRKDGTMFWNEITLIPIRNEEQVLTHFIGIQFNVSAQREYNELQAAYDIINEQIQNFAKQSDELRRVNAQLHLSHERINDLAATLAHDLQNPIAAMMSFVEVMRDSDTLSAEDRKMYGDVAYETAERMLPIIRRLVDIGRLAKQEIKPLELFALNVSSLVELLVSGYVYRANSKGITIDSDISQAFWVLADETSLYEVIDNLLSNALKYTPHNKRVGVRLARHGEHIRIAIWDEGPGLSDHDKTKIFKHNGRLSARPTDGETSTGLGLVIVQSMVQRMNGRVWCESEHGCGATFFVELPAVDV
jgi:PAS domain S-box-containing protein